MKKRWIFLISTLLLLAAVGGLLSRKASNSLTENEHPTMEKVPSISQNPGQQPETETAKEPVTDGNRVIKEYPELNIKIDAICPSDREATEMHGLTARLSRTYYDAMLREIYLSEFPDSQEIRKDVWVCYDSNSEHLSHMDMSETGSVDYGVRERDVNGDPDFHDSGYYDPMDVSALDQAENSGTFTREMAVKQAISLLKPYTDFDLVPVNIFEENGSNGKNWYRMALQMFYKGTPVSIASLLPMPSVNNELFYHVTGLDVGYGQNGVGYLQGVFNFDNIVETGSYSCLNLNEIIPVFIDQAKALLEGTEGKTAWNIYRIQRELFMEGGEHPGEYIFKPVWAFYFTEEVPGLNTYSKTIKLDAENGTLLTNSIQ